MDFNEAVDRFTGKNEHLFGRLAHRMGIGESRAYRFRMDKDKKSYVAPPANWKNAMLEIAIEHLLEYREFVQELQKEVNKRG